MIRRSPGKTRLVSSCPESAVDAFKRLVAEQMAIVLKREAAAARGSVEALHDLRVALRRIRNLAKAFKKLDREYLDQLDRRIAKVCDRMGDARDMDVWIDLLKGLIAAGGLENMPARDQKAVLTVLRRQRNQLAAKALSCKLFRRVKQDLNTRLQKRKGWRKKVPALNVFSARRMLRTRKLISDRYRRVGNFSKDPAHDLRRAGRRLRYLSEFFAAGLGRESVRAGKWITKAQATLGKVHDCDNALELSQALPSGAARVAVRKALKIRRADQLRKFKTAWRHYADKRLQKAWLARLEAAAAG